MTKLGIRDGATVALLHSPEGFEFEPPDGVLVRRRARGRCDVVVAFFTRVSKVDHSIATLERMIYPDGGLWIAWPKRSSGVATDVTDHAIRELALTRQLVDNKVCAIDDVWTALRLVWRRAVRP